MGDERERSGRVEETVSDGKQKAGAPAREMLAQQMIGRGTRARSERRKGVHGEAARSRWTAESRGRDNQLQQVQAGMRFKKKEDAHQSSEEEMNVRDKYHNI